MFSFFSNNRFKTLTEIDIHSHLIPEIDDGAKDMNNSVELIEELYSLGYRKLIITPHISDMFPNSKNIILDGYYALREELGIRDIKMKIDIGAEYYIDDSFTELLEREELLSFGKENYLLFEFSYFTPPPDIDNLIHDIILKGYTPVLAHPERYFYWHHDFNKYKELREMGVLFQINLNSLNGHYNKSVQNIVERLIKDSYVDFVGSDTHHMKHIISLKKIFSLSIYRKIFKYNTILNKTLEI